MSTMNKTQGAMARRLDTKHMAREGVEKSARGLKAGARTTRSRSGMTCLYFTLDSVLFYSISCILIARKEACLHGRKHGSNNSEQEQSMLSQIRQTSFCSALNPSFPTNHVAAPQFIEATCPPSRPSFETRNSILGTQCRRRTSFPRITVHAFLITPEIVLLD